MWMWAAVAWAQSAEIRAASASCTGGDGPACAVVAGAMVRGELGEPDFVRALGLYQRACTAGDAASCAVTDPFSTAKRVAHPDDTALAAVVLDANNRPVDLGAARTTWTAACERGNDLACGDLGSSYLWTEPADPAVARRWLMRACLSPADVGCSELGVLMRDGLGGAADPDAAFVALAKGCFDPNRHGPGTGRGCEALGDLIVSGKAGPIDPALVDRAYTLACGGQMNATACKKAEDAK